MQARLLTQNELFSNYIYMFILSSAAYFRPIELEAIIAQMLFISTILSKANETWAGCKCRNTRVISRAENSTSKTCFLISSLNKFLFIQNFFLCPFESYRVTRPMREMRFGAYVTWAISTPCIDAVT